MKNLKLSKKLSLLLFLGACATRGPESNSGPDQIAAGATPLVAGAPAKDEVRISEGDQTDWYILNGENVEAEVTLLTAAGKEIDVKAYRVTGRSRSQVFLKYLKPAKGYRFNIKKDDVYIQVRARTNSSDLKYPLVRRDLNKGGNTAKLSKLNVIDIYPLADARSLVLLTATDELKVGSTLAISGQSGSAKAVDLGDCEVGSVGGGQASCTLPSQPKNKFGRYRASQVN